MTTTFLHVTLIRIPLIRRLQNAAARSYVRDLESVALSVNASAFNITH
jgi:hypothetical protein